MKGATTPVVVVPAVWVVVLDVPVVGSLLVGCGEVEPVRVVDPSVVVPEVDVVTAPLEAAPVGAVLVDGAGAVAVDVVGATTAAVVSEVVGATVVSESVVSPAL